MFGGGEEDADLAAALAASVVSAAAKAAADRDEARALAASLAEAHVHATAATGSSAAAARAARSREADEDARTLALAIEASKRMTAPPVATGHERVILKVGSALAGRVVGAQFKETNEIAWIAGDGCTITLADPLLSDTDMYVVITAGTLRALDIAEDLVLLRCSSLNTLGAPAGGCDAPSPQAGARRQTGYSAFGGGGGDGGPSSAGGPSRVPWSPPRGSVDLSHAKQLRVSSRVRHIFVDNSNIFIGAKDIVGGVPDLRLRLDLPALHEVLLRGGAGAEAGSSGGGATIARRFVCGSRPPREGGIWAVWEREGYDVKVVARDETNREETVDSCLHAAGMKLVLDVIVTAEPGAHTLVLATGDGDRNDGRTSFPQLAYDAAVHGARVEVWAWRKSCSRNFFDLAAILPDRISLHFLDEHRSRRGVNLNGHETATPRRTFKLL